MYLHNTYSCILGICCCLLRFYTVTHAIMCSIFSVFCSVSAYMVSQSDFDIWSFTEPPCLQMTRL